MLDRNKRHVSKFVSSSVSPCKKRKRLTKSALIKIHNLGIPLISSETGLPLDSIRLAADRAYTIGRDSVSCDFVFSNRLVSKKHCQIFFDNRYSRLCLIDGTLKSGNVSFIWADESRRRMSFDEQIEGEKVMAASSRVNVSLNGVFVNGVRITEGMVKELLAGDEVSFVCGSEGVCNLKTRIGFVIQRITLSDGVYVYNELELERWGSPGQSQGTVSSGMGNKRVFASREVTATSPMMEYPVQESARVLKRAQSLIKCCKYILYSNDPIACMKECASLDSEKECRYGCHISILGSDIDQLDNAPVSGEIQRASPVQGREQSLFDSRHSKIPKGTTKGISDLINNVLPCDPLCHKVSAGASNEEDAVIDKCKYVNKENSPLVDCAYECKFHQNPIPSSGKFFYLNRLQFMDQSWHGHQSTVSLPELLHPIEKISRIFIATFTNDIPWFLSSCKIPCHLPVTIACHNTTRCWSSSSDSRSSIPYPEFPNLVVLFPPFPEAIAFGQDCKRQGIACHHPKLIILQKEDSIRVIITSANLNAKQWNSVTNTVWWQDFPRRNVPNYISLFAQISAEEINQGSKSDFAAQLAGFVASLSIDVPSQAHWVAELTKYDFEGATGHLVASVPGMHSYKARYPLGSMNFMHFLGTVESSVVGLSHLFRSAADSNGAQLKKLASFLGKSRKNSFGMLEIVLRRNTNVPADANAVSVLVPNPDDTSAADCIQLGFLPRNFAKWVSPLWDIGFFRFSGYIYCDEALEAAFGESNQKVQLLLHVSQGSSFPEMSKMIKPLHVVALSSLVALVQRCTGLWRVQEVLGQYEWPESQETDFTYGASSIGSVNAEFLASFAAAAGKRSLQTFESEESDPEWGGWSVREELKKPSIRIIFPTIERVKKACDGIKSSRRLLCFSEKTWQRLRYLDILNDAIPHPSEREGHPSHVKVARRRFKSKIDGSSFGWVYCGSHNFSAAAWGRIISKPSRKNGNSSYHTDSASDGSRLHVSNYELGIIFVCPPPKGTNSVIRSNTNLDDIALPFIVPPPKYGPRDRPATARAMRDALQEQYEKDRISLAEVEANEEMEEIPDEEEEVVEAATDYVGAEEKEEEKAYADALWSQVDSSAGSSTP